VQALKVAVAAKAAQAQLTFTALTASKPAGIGTNPFGTNPFGTASLILMYRGIEDANAAAALIGADAAESVPLMLRHPIPLLFAGGEVLAPQPHAMAIQQWLEWEEVCLRPATYAAQPRELQAALDHLETALAASTTGYLSRKKLTTADVSTSSGS
jgi:hypothetical protein